MATPSETGVRLKQALIAAGHAVTAVGIGDVTNRSTWRVAPTGLQGACQSLIDTFDPDDPALLAAALTAQAQLTSRQKDILTTCALIVRARGIAAWNNLSTPQKVAAAQAEADVWRDMRVWAENNLGG